MFAERSAPVNRSTVPQSRTSASLGSASRYTCLRLTVLTMPGSWSRWLVLVLRNGPAVGLVLGPRAIPGVEGWYCRRGLGAGPGAVGWSWSQSLGTGPGAEACSLTRGQVLEPTAGILSWSRRLGLFLVLGASDADALAAGVFAPDVLVFRPAEPVVHDNEVVRPVEPDVLLCSWSLGWSWLRSLGAGPVAGVCVLVLESTAGPGAVGWSWLRWLGTGPVVEVWSLTRGLALEPTAGDLSWCRCLELILEPRAGHWSLSLGCSGCH